MNKNNLFEDSDEEIEDFLDVDQPIPGQNFCCISFLSPEKVIQQKETFFAKKFLEYCLNNEETKKELSNQNTISYNKIDDMYENFKVLNEKNVQDEFNKSVDFQTNIRGIKVRGVYDTLKEAKIRSKILQKRDKKFHVFVGQIGYWLPWDPNENDIKDQEYQEQQLNELMKKYRENQENRDEIYHETKENRIKKAKEDTKRKKEELGHLKSPDENPEQKIAELRSLADERDRILEQQIKANKYDDPLNSLSGDADPWMQNKNRMKNTTQYDNISIQKDNKIEEISDNIF